MTDALREAGRQQHQLLATARRIVCTARQQFWLEPLDIRGECGPHRGVVFQEVPELRWRVQIWSPSSSSCGRDSYQRENRAGSASSRARDSGDGT